MLKLILTAIIVLHGAVHIWYVLLIGGVVTYIPEMGWTGKSWLLPGSPADGIYRISGVLLYSLAALMFMISGQGMLTDKAWYPEVLLTTAMVSSVILLFFFDGRFHMLVQKGLIGIVINCIIILTLAVKCFL